MTERRRSQMYNFQKHTENNMIRNANKSGVSSYLMYRAIKEGIVSVNPSIMDWMDEGMGPGGFYITWKEGWSIKDLHTSVRLKDKKKYLAYRSDG